MGWAAAAVLTLGGGPPWHNPSEGEGLDCPTSHGQIFARGSPLGGNLLLGRGPHFSTPPPPRGDGVCGGVHVSQVPAQGRLTILGSYYILWLLPPRGGCMCVRLPTRGHPTSGVYILGGGEGDFTRGSPLVYGVFMEAGPNFVRGSPLSCMGGGCP